MSRARVYAVLMAAVLATGLAVGGCAGGGRSGERDGAAERPVVVALGDSIAANETWDCPGCLGFVDSYAEAVGAQAVNLARGGALTRWVAEQVTSGEVADELEDADVVLVSWGGNDLPPYRQGYQPCHVDMQRSFLEAAEDVAATTTECVDEVVDLLRGVVTEALLDLREQAPEAEIAVLPPYDFWLGRPQLDAVPTRTRAAALRLVRYAVSSWRDTLCAVAAEVDATCIDLYEAFNGPDGDRPAGDLLGSDHTHPSQAGNDLVRDLLVEANLVATTRS